MIEYSVEIDNSAVNSALNNAAQSLGNINNVLATIGNHVLNNALLGFHDSKNPYGEPWAAIRHRVGQPLRDTGRLMNSFTYNVISNQAVEVGTNTVYFTRHQRGDGDNGKGVKQRMMLPIQSRGLPAEWERQIMQDIDNFVRGVFN